MNFSHVLTIFVAFFMIPGLNGYRFKYLGCYIDSDSNGRDIVGKDFTFSSLTLETCINQCQPTGYPYAGLQFASRCLCGNSYGRTGYSLYCNCTCGGVYCGGYMSNDVFYTVDNSLEGQRDFVYRATPMTFDSARMSCVSANGDLPVVDSDQAIAKIISLQKTSNSSTVPTNVWIGLHRRLQTYPYEWTNENNQQYSDRASDYVPLWASTDDPGLDCVSINVAKQKLESKACTETFPFACNQLPPVTTPVPDTVDVNTDSGMAVSNPSADSNRLALYIVMPLFLLCYGGSCILYCAYKIYRNCCMKKRTAMYFEQVPSHPSDMAKAQMGGMPPMGPHLLGPAGGVYKRPLSGGIKKSAVYPMPMEGMGMVTKGGDQLPKYEPSGPGDVKKDLGQMRKPVCIPKQGEGNILSPPPNYYGSNPFGGPPAVPGVPGMQLVPPNPMQPVPGEDAYNMSISEILKKKMMEKDRASKEHAK